MVRQCNWGCQNVFNSDANTLEEYNGTNPQGLRVYGTRTDASNYERIGFKWDNADGYFAVASENGGSGSQRGNRVLDREHCAVGD